MLDVVRHRHPPFLRGLLPRTVVLSKAERIPPATENGPPRSAPRSQGAQGASYPSALPRQWVSAARLSQTRCGNLTTHSRGLVPGSRNMGKQVAISVLRDDSPLVRPGRRRAVVTPLDYGLISGNSSASRGLRTPAPGPLTRPGRRCGPRPVRVRDGRPPCCPARPAPRGERFGAVLGHQADAGAAVEEVRLVQGALVPDRPEQLGPGDGVAGQHGFGQGGVVGGEGVDRHGLGAVAADQTAGRGQRASRSGAAAPVSGSVAVGEGPVRRPRAAVAASTASCAIRR